MAPPRPDRPASSRRLRSEAPIDVFAFLDLQQLLGAYYEARKAQGRGFSYRAFSKRAGLRSPNHLKRVIDGERPLTAPMAVRYADAMDLVGDAHAYFLDLAAFSRAETVDERNAAYARLASYRRVREAHRLELAHAAYHASWYVPAIRELAATPGFREDPAWIARTLVPPITRAEASDALDTLLDLGLLTRDPAGRLVHGEAVVTTGAETRGLHIANYHRAMIARAADAIDIVPRGERDISSLTFACTTEDLAEVKRRVAAFRREIIALLADRADGDRVVQLNFQLFPLSRSPETA
jgi:uncharacterized protein (TIGR02147 family)